MGILKKLTKEYFGEIERKEDYVKFNTDKMIPFDMGGSVLWADRDLEVEDGGGWYKYDMYFNGNEMLKMRLKDGWRVPTFDEFLELFDIRTGTERKNIVSVSPYSIIKVTFVNDDKVLEFETRGYYKKDMPGTLMYPNFIFHRMTCETSEFGGTDCVNVINCNCDEKDIKAFQKDKKNRGLIAIDAIYVPIRLVKDKK